MTPQILVCFVQLFLVKMLQNLQSDLLTLHIRYTIIVRGQNNDFKDKVAKYNVLGVEMESFALFTNAKLLNKKAATLLMVSDSFIYPDKLSSLEREQGLDNLITLALETSLKL